MTGERGPFNSGVEAARKFRWGAQGCTCTAACVLQCKPGNLFGVIAEGRQRLFLAQTAEVERSTPRNGNRCNRGGPHTAGLQCWGTALEQAGKQARGGKQNSGFPPATVQRPFVKALKGPRHWCGRSQFITRVVIGIIAVSERKDLQRRALEASAAQFPVKLVLPLWVSIAIRQPCQDFNMYPSGGTAWISPAGTLLH